MLRARTLEELLDAAALLSSQPLPRGPRVGVITNAGGLGILCADACDAAGLELPALADETTAALAALVPAEASLANPVDLLGSATAEPYEAAIAAVLADPNIDAVIVIFVPPVVAGADDVAAAICRAVTKSSRTKPVIAVVVSADGTPAVLRESGAPVAALPYPESAAPALALSLQRSTWLRRPEQEAPAVDGIDTAAARRVAESALADATDAWLAPGSRPCTARGIRDSARCRTTRRRCGRRRRGRPRARLSGRPQDGGPGVHKTELGGVALDLRDEAQVRAAARRSVGRSSFSRSWLATPNYWPAWSRIRPSGRSWPSGRAAAWPS